MQLSDIRTRHNQPVCSQMRSVPCSKIGINLVNVTSSVSLLIYDDVLAFFSHFVLGFMYRHQYLVLLTSKKSLSPQFALFLLC